jgi:TfoX/Sxy family transcriptional regulator of competence genes
MDTAERWAWLVEQLLAAGTATYGSGAEAGAKRMFGSTSLKTNGKMFAFVAHERLIVKLPAARVEALVGEGAGERYDPGHGRLQKEWLQVATEDPDAWLRLATEAEAYVGRRRSG